MSFGFGDPAAFLSITGECFSVDALSGEDNSVEPDVVAGWVAELAWFGLRGIRADERSSAKA